MNTAKCKCDVSHCHALQIAERAYDGDEYNVCEFHRNVIDSIAKLPEARQQEMIEATRGHMSKETPD